jgi:hypothetical protein
MGLKIKSGVSTQVNTASAVKEVVDQIKQDGIKLVVFFSTTGHDGQQLTQALASALPGVKLAGCSTSGEITPKGFITKSLTAMSFSSPDFAAGIGLAAGLATQPQKVASEALTQAFKDLGSDVNSFDPAKHVLMVLPDGMSGKEEMFLLGLNDVAPQLSVVGGSAGDDLQFKQTYVSNGKQALSNAAVVVLIKTSHPWTMVKTSSYLPTGKTLTITKADPENRVVNEFDHKPAMAAYADAVNLSVDKAAEAFMDHPIAVELPDGFYNRSPQQVMPNQGMKFYCNIAEGVKVAVMQPGDVNANLSKLMDEMKKKLNGKVAGFLAFNCILRFLEAQNKKLNEDLFKTLNIAPVIGFATYGEQFNTLHINQTLTVLAFGE